MSTKTAPTNASSRPGASPMPPPINSSTIVLEGGQGRVLAVADIRGKLSQLNQLAAEHHAQAVIHTGDFGFFEHGSLARISDRTLRHMIMYSPLIPQDNRNSLLEQNPAALRTSLAASTSSHLSEFPLLLTGQLKLAVPVFTVWGACEDVTVLEKFRAGQYDIPNLHVLDEATTRLLDVGGIKLRLLGLGGAFVPHRMFDNGEGQATVAGGQGTMWTTALQIGELVDTSQKVFDPSETRLLVTHASPGREGLLAQLALVVKADLTISAGLHFRYSSSWNEFSVQGDIDGYRQKLIGGKDSFERIWENVKTQVDAVIDDAQRVLLNKAIMVAERILPSPAPGTVAQEDPAWKNCWNWNLCDAAYGSLMLDIKEGRVSAELKSQGFNFAYRRTATGATANPNASAAPAAAPPSVSHPPTKSSTPAPTAPAPPTQNAPPPAKSPAPTSGKDTPAPLTNGASTPSSAVATDPKAAAKKEKRKEKEREKRERDKEEKAKAKDDDKKDTPQKPPIKTATPPLNADDGQNGPLSPSDGARTPTSLKPRRNPWTLFMKLPVTGTEADIREYFTPESRSGITRVNLPPSHGSRPTRIAYIEFGDEAAMRDGLAKHADKIKDMSVSVVVADENKPGSGADASPSQFGSVRGRGRGRGGGFGGGFAHRGLAAAGLTKPHSTDE